MKRKLDHGWSVGPEGLLVRGEGRAKAEARPTELMPSKTGERDFNPHTDAFAVRLGGEFNGPNRYQEGDLQVDANGACRDAAECPECGSLHGEYRFAVRVETLQGNAWDSDYTYCRRCCSAAEIDEIRRRAEAPANKTTRARRR